MKGISDLVCERLKNVLITDKTGALSSKLNSILEKELGTVLDNYFELEDVFVQVQYDTDGDPYIHLLGKILSFKPIGIIE